ncbi:PfkB family carbohydrate kinase [Verrucosispora sp. WMMA2121]|uniref:PfkB family carbohydrate kinase n=1 Tax=Verrucosispora sp. WMMA2121 TaxID=3015164 RepID=UPI0022B70C40|nr:PfkB family carbohydrate kinase [Verrucosispora sp. WMMA2121]MCZ7422962.1 PfkB family carbohydrate kinase [Verrucosispora sp. WMMA2121]
MTKQVVGIGPSIIDVAAQLPELDLSKCLETLSLKPGQWRRIDYDAVQSLLEIILGADALLASAAGLPANVVIRPGSTIANALLAMPGDDSLRRALITSIALDSGGIDPMARRFSDDIQAAGITHHGVPVAGRNPVAFVLSSQQRTERTLAMFPGVADELKGFDLSSLSPDLVMVDAYNLGDHPLGRWLDRVITSRTFQILLSLGNYNILTGHLARRILSFLDAGCLTAVCGNLSEFRSLFGGFGGGSESVSALVERAGTAVPYVLLTQGRDGMMASWQGQRIAMPATWMHRAAIRSTAGAGDAAAGVFAAGILRRQEPTEVLKGAASAAAQALLRL